MNILIVGDIGIIFTYEYILNIASKLPDAHVDVLSFCPRTDKNRARAEHLESLGCRIYDQPRYRLLRAVKPLHPVLRLREALRYRVCRKYDVIHLHYIGIDAWCIPKYASPGARVIASVYGSDLLRAGKSMLPVLEKVFTRADVITVAGRYVREVVSRTFNARFDDKVKTVRYGSEAAAYMHENLNRLDRIDCKTHNDLPLDRRIVLCGYNGSPTQRQLEIIEQCKRLPEAFRDRLFLLFQCSYGSTPAHLAAIAEALQASGLKGKIVTDFMRGETLARFRKSVDVFLNLQPTDVLSATMIEELEAGAIVVKGSWLHYPDLDDQGVYMLSLSDMDTLPAMLIDILERYPAHQAELTRNEGIWKLLSWEEEFPKWHAVVCPDVKE